MENDRLAIIDEPRDDGCTLIRGRQLLDALRQFSWAQAHPDGVLIITSKTSTARKSLEAAGYHVTSAGEPPEERRPERPRRMPLPLPECAHCHAPYRRNHQVRADEYCTECGWRLVLEQYDPNAPDTPGPGSTCPDCGRTIQRGWRFCRCGIELDAAQLDLAIRDTRPWRERYADLIAQSRADAIRDFTTGGAFAMPEGTDQ